MSTQNQNNAEEAPEFVKSAKEIIDMNITEMPFLVEGLFQQTGIASLVGTSDVGKSTLLRELSESIIFGKERFLGFELSTKHQSVIYVSSEDDDYALSYYYNSIYGDDELAKEGYQNLRYIFQTNNLIKKLDNELSRKPADCVFIDAFGDLYPGRMNDYNQVRSYLEYYYGLAVKHRCLFIFLHHIGKRTENNEPSKNNVLGSQGFEGKMRSLVELRMDPTDHNKRHLCILKGNYFSAEHKSKTWILQFKNRKFMFTGKEGKKTDLKCSDTSSKRDLYFDDFLEIREENPDFTVDQLLAAMENKGCDISRGTIGNWNTELNRQEQ